MDAKTIDHIIVLMMCGRSFDHMLGGLRAIDPRIDGLTGAESNLDSAGRQVPVQPIAAYQGLDPAPASNFQSVNRQIYDAQSMAQAPTMGGFVKDYFERRRDVAASHRVMHYFTPDRLPVLSTLAREFAVCNRWFSSVPGPTAPNRSFVHYATSFGRVDQAEAPADPDVKSLLERLLEQDLTARNYYYNGASGTLNLPLQQTAPKLFGTFDQFLVDCRTGALPAYAFLEPNYADQVVNGEAVPSSSQQADHHVLAGERFIATVYTALRSNESVWSRSALVITYDSHGGLYDHVPPPACVPDRYAANASNTGAGEFKFDRLGVRVPAVIVSPWIKRGTVINRVLEHASIPATVAQLFLREDSKASPRERAAGTFVDLLTSSPARTDAVRTDTPAFELDSIATPPALLPPVISGYRSDVAAGDDMLNLGTEVETLCAVLAADDVRPPVSVGLFGDWGSGKTFFMRMMEKEFDRIKAHARATPGKTAFCSNIVQLWFNAWHYIDKNIWASLAAEIFDRLAEAIAYDRTDDREKKDVNYRRAELTAKAAAGKQELDAKLREQAEAENALRENERSLSALEAEAGRVVDTRGYVTRLLRGTVALALAQPEIHEELKKTQQSVDDQLKRAALALHVPDADAQTLTVKNELLEFRGLAGSVRALFYAIRHTRQPWMWGLLPFAAVGVGLAIRWLNATTAVWLPWLVSVSGVFVIVARFLPGARRAVKLVEDARAEGMRAVEAQLQKRRDSLGNDVKASRLRVDQARAAAVQAQKSVDELVSALDNLKADKQLATFIQGRRDSSDYKKHLGVIARAYADFDELSVLLARSREERQQLASAVAPSGAAPVLPSIDRIVLYIDDLDRCPEAKVVEVLQAIHLLLFFPLFVVVVGVDSRWLLHSLRRHSPVFRAGADPVAEGESDSAHWRSTPLDYLEKIFQMPFALEPMRPDGFARLVDDLTMSRVGTSPARKAANANGGTAQPGHSESPNDIDVSDTPTDVEGAGATRVGAAASNDQRPFDPNPDYLILSEEERSFMKTLHPLIRSPRAAKRFVNVYRLLRTAVTTEEKDVFVTEDGTGEFQTVQLLLAMQTGYPDQTSVIVRNLIERRPSGLWWRFVDRLVAAVTKHPGPTAEGWEEFAEQLKKLKPEFSRSDIDEFVRWAPRVARFSFQSARVLQAVELDQP